MKALRLLPKVAAVGTIGLSSYTTANMMSIPDRMFLKPEAKSADWSSTSLIPVKFVSDEVVEEPAKWAKDVIAKHSGSSGCIIFVVRRPG